jgi:hypothetical protein
MGLRIHAGFGLLMIFSTSISVSFSIPFSSFSPFGIHSFLVPKTISTGKNLQYFLTYF